jgi:peptidyl-prolyl cis-trans isomerase SurA
LTKLFFICLSLIFTFNLSAQEVADKIVAVVDNEIILQSELDFHTAAVAAQRKMDPAMPGLKEQVLNSLIEEKLILAQAGLDSIIISEEEVEQRLNYQIDLFIQQYGSRQRVEEMYGMTIERIKRESRDDIRKQLMIQRVREKNFGMIEASRREVEEFFNIYKDSLGVIPERVKISHIFQNPKASAKVKEESRKFAQSILDSIKQGADFAEAAKKYSQDPASAVEGGDLGFVRRGVFYPEFESAAFSLRDGELSGVVESPVGFHIIQLLEKRGESIHTRHILIKIKTDEAADLKTIEFLSEVRDSIIQGHGTFAAFARKYSEDEDSKSFGGSLGTFYLNQLDKTLLDIVSRLKVGEISFPRRIEYAPEIYGYHIVFLEERVPQHAASLELDYNEIKRFADEYKRQQRYSDWLEKIKNRVYWEVKI